MKKRKGVPASAVFNANIAAAGEAMLESPGRGLVYIYSPNTVLTRAARRWALPEKIKDWQYVTATSTSGTSIRCGTLNVVRQIKCRGQKALEMQ